ncbi:DUF2934 domain-containing protein [Streptomyces sp. NPDC047461]|uniref:DUF2934 domain-containing protein n=1 Tax=Streptomyces sp. NPDC047461 TaxID=3155619 RepID=UPI0033C72E95
MSTRTEWAPFPSRPVQPWPDVRQLRQQFVEEAAYLHWIGRGRPFGDPLTDWFAAEAELRDALTGRRGYRPTAL